VKFDRILLRNTQPGERLTSRDIHDRLKSRYKMFPTPHNIAMYLRKSPAFRPVDTTTTYRLDTAYNTTVWERV
jgi:hypothetical protein